MNHLRTLKPLSQKQLLRQQTLISKLNDVFYKKQSTTAWINLFWMSYVFWKSNSHVSLIACKIPWIGQSLHPLLNLIEGLCNLLLFCLMKWRRFIELSCHCKVANSSSVGTNTICGSLDISSWKMNSRVSLRFLSSPLLLKGTIALTVKHSILLA